MTKRHHRAWRFIERCKTSDGRELTAYRANNADSRGPSMRELMAQGDVITAADVRTMMKPMTDGRLKLRPTDADVGHIAEFLNIVRVTRHREEVEEDLPHPEERARLSHALETILKDGTTILADKTDELDSLGQNADPASIARVQQFSLDLATLIASAQRVWQAPGINPASRADDARSYWHRDLEWLAWKLDQIQDRAARPSVTKAESPAIKFIVAALRRADGIPEDDGTDTISDTIAKALTRRRNRPPKAYDFPPRRGGQ